MPLEFDKGTDGQVDWGEAQAIIAGAKVTVQLFVIRLCYSRKLFARAYPTQRQEAFLEGHIHAFRHFRGIPHRLSYDNLLVLTFSVVIDDSRPWRQKSEGCATSCRDRRSH